MRKILALTRASWLEAASYRVRTVVGFVTLVVGALPFYYVARGLQSVVGESIQNQGGDYFAFLVIGTVAFAFIRASVSVLPDEIGRAIGSGTMEALLGTPTRVSTLVAGMVGYAFTWTTARTGVFLVIAWYMGANLIWPRMPLALVILSLIVVAYLGFGLMAAALVLAFRTPGPIPTGIVWISTFFGGVYYPTNSIPDWLQGVTNFVPLGYGLRPLRRVLLEPVLATGVLSQDLVPLSLMAGASFVVGVVALTSALRYARHSGTLAQY